MGGPDSPDYKRFLDLCAQAFNILRKNAFLIINLLAMMVSACIYVFLCRNSTVNRSAQDRICD